jgi:hypothetical protein
MPDGTVITAPDTPMDGLRDFPDRLPPMLVKELRQGLRGRMFVMPFLGVHAMLLLSGILGPAGDGPFLWHVIAVMLVFLLPSRTLGALGEEREGNTLDTLVLTRLTPWRIVWGKWCASVAQSALTAVSVLPYLLVRYLNIGTSFIHEGLMLLVFFLLSGAVAGIFTVFSTVQSTLVRNGMAGALIALIYVRFCWPLIQGRAAGETPDLAAIAVVAAWAALFSLGHAAASIAPAAANLTTGRRLTSLAAVALLGWIASSNGDSSVTSWVTIILVAACFVEMGERQNFHPAIASRFARFGIVGRTAALIFHPGWGTGVLFCTMLWSFAGILVGNFRHWPVASLCFFPVVARCLLPDRWRFGPAVMLLFAGLSHVVSLLLSQFRVAGASFFALMLPSLHFRLMAESFTFVWAGAALLLAVAPLLELTRQFRKVQPAG